MNGAQVIVEILREQGVDTLFGYPGGMILPLYDALFDAKDINQILTTHEQNAAHGADGYARATGKVGVCSHLRPRGYQSGNWLGYSLYGFYSCGGFYRTGRYRPAGTGFLSGNRHYGCYHACYQA